MIPNFWDCKTCRSMGLDREQRDCLLERERTTITAPVQGVMTRDEILSLVDPEDMLKDLGARLSPRTGPPRVRGVGGRPVCPLPLPDPSALGIVAMAVDASEHGMPLADTMRVRSAMRAVRQAQAMAQRVSIRRQSKGGQA